MNLSPTITLDSKTVPGVKVTVKRMGLVPRSAVEAATLKTRQRMAEIQAAYPINTPEELALQEEIAILRRKAALVPAEEMPAVVRKEIVPKLLELAAAITDEVRQKRAPLDEEWATLKRQQQPCWIKEGLVAIEQKAGDGTPGDFDGMKADDLCNFGPPELAEEIAEELKNNGRMSPSDRQGFESPITSGARADGQTTGTDAPPAKSDSSTSSETASSISQAA